MISHSRIVADHPGLVRPDAEHFHRMIVGSLLGLAEAVLGEAGMSWAGTGSTSTGGRPATRPGSPVTGRLREVIQRRYAARGNSTLVMGTATRMPRSRSTGAIRGAIGRAGCNGNPAQVKRDGRATHHTFRDTFASWLVQRGVSLFKVQQLLGIRARR
jgi:integrase